MALSPDEVTLLVTLTPTLVAAGAAWVANKAVELMRDKFHMTVSDAQVKTVHDAVNTAVGVLLSQVSRGVLTPADLHAGNAAVVAAAAGARQAVPDAADAKSTTVDDIVRMVVGQLGHEAPYAVQAAKQTAGSVTPSTPAVAGNTTVVKDIPPHA